MGNTQPKRVDMDVSCLELSWDEKTQRPKYVDKKAAYVFNFYGEYSRDEFLRAGIDDPEFERMVKEDVEHYTSNYHVYRNCRSCAHRIYYKDQKYGFAWFNMAYIDPMCTIELLCNESDQVAKIPAKIQRFLGDVHICMQCMRTGRIIKWSGTDAEVAANYVCDLVADLDIYVVQNDMGIHDTKTIVKDKEELQSTLTKLIKYMLSIKELESHSQPKKIKSP